MDYHGIVHLLFFRRLAYAKSYIMSSKTTGSCKNPSGCDGVLVLTSESQQSSVTCGKCSQSFCVRCEMPPHAPAGCEVMKQWHTRGGYIDLSTHDMAALELVLRTTKPCPKCGVRIEKNQGCPHMTVSAVCLGASVIERP